ncbi:MAG: GerW family sporulation protein [Oscillospiraceae bacterium]|nr:GerW family sporulation protein [Oscillospiraceae bacterium]
MENNSNIGNLMDVTMSRLKEIVDVDTVVGTPVQTADGVTIIPVSKVSYAFASGGSDFRVKERSDLGFGGGNGAGVKIDPIGFLVVKDGNVRMLTIMPPANSTVDRVIEKAPELIDAVENFIRAHSKGGKNETDAAGGEGAENAENA